MLKFMDVAKKYYSVYALKGVNLTIIPNNLYLFIGENGSGKSTTIKLISKVIFTNDYKTFENDFKEIIYLPDKRNYPKLLTTLVFLKYYIDIDENIIIKYMEKYNLQNKRIGSLSKGNIQKLGIIQILLSKGDLYLFDEPIDGLDKESIKLFVEDLKELLSKNKTIIISTHNKNVYKELNPIIYKFNNGVCNEKKK